MSISYWTGTPKGLTFSVAVILFLSGCAVTLAPNYDKAIVDGLLATNIALMEHFAATAAGTEKETFVEREQRYNHLIGNLDALAIQTKARPVPSNKVTEKINNSLSERGIQVTDGDEAPSATALDAISKTITKMRDTDRKQGVTAVEVAAFKGQVVIFLDQAITYENFLER